jgi:transcriptional regulator with XRE-family HTH domain
MKTLASNIIFIRKQYNLSQSNLANKINVNPRTVSKWELDQQSPTIVELLRISEVFNIEFDMLLKQDLSGFPNTQPIDKYILLDNIDYLLKKQAMTIRGLAQALGINSAEIHAWIERKREPAPHIITRIARIFSLSVDALVGYKMSK